MKTDAFPMIETRIKRTFRAQHSLPLFAGPEPHCHDYEVTVGYRHEIAPTTGATKSLFDVLSAINPLMARLDGANLNTLWKAPPTAEFLALYILRELPPYFDFVEIHAYDVLTVRAEQRGARFHWLDYTP